MPTRTRLEMLPLYDITRMTARRLVVIATTLFLDCRRSKNELGDRQSSNYRVRAFLPSVYLNVDLSLAVTPCRSRKENGHLPPCYAMGSMQDSVILGDHPSTMSALRRVVPQGVASILYC